VRKIKCLLGCLTAVSSNKGKKTAATLLQHTRQPIFRPTEVAVLRDPCMEQTLPIISAAARWNDTSGIVASSTRILETTPAACAAAQIVLDNPATNKVGRQSPCGPARRPAIRQVPQPVVISAPHVPSGPCRCADRSCKLAGWFSPRRRCGGDEDVESTRPQPAVRPCRQMPYIWWTLAPIRPPQTIGNQLERRRTSARKFTVGQGSLPRIHAMRHASTARVSGRQWPREQRRT
jgi:hypothetical protein